MKILTDRVRVLIVDDQEAFRSAARLVVELTDGFEVVGEATSGEEGVDLVASLSPDLVLMDINMPGIDGLEATRLIKRSHPETIVVIFSTYEPGEYESRAWAAGAMSFVSKADFDSARLSAIWESAG